MLVKISINVAHDEKSSSTKQRKKKTFKANKLSLLSYWKVTPDTSKWKNWELFMFSIYLTENKLIVFFPNNYLSGNLTYTMFSEVKSGRKFGIT